MNISIFKSLTCNNTVRIIALLLLLGYTSSVSAQDYLADLFEDYYNDQNDSSGHNKTIALSVQLGPSVSWFSGAMGSESYQVGTTGGIGLELFLGKALGLSFEADYTQEGVSKASPYLLHTESYLSSLSPDEAITHSNLRLHSLSAPLCLTVRLPQLHNAAYRPKFELGGYFNYLLWADAKNTTLVGGGKSRDVSANFSATGFGAIAGIALEINRVHLFSVSLRYKHGLQELSRLNFPARYARGTTYGNAVHLQLKACF